MFFETSKDMGSLTGAKCPHLPRSAELLPRNVDGEGHLLGAALKNADPKDSFYLTEKPSSPNTQTHLIGQTTSLNRRGADRVGGESVCWFWVVSDVRLVIDPLGRLCAMLRGI